MSEIGSNQLQSISREDHRNHREYGKGWKKDSGGNGRNQENWRYERDEDRHKQEKNGEERYRTDQNRKNKKNAHIENKNRNTEKANNVHLVQWNICKKQDGRMDPYSCIVDTGCPKTVAR